MLKNLRRQINIFIKDFLWNKKLELIAFDKKDSNFIRLMNSIKKKTRIWIYYDESYNLYHLMKRNSKLSGNIAEVGVADGASALILAELKKDKKLFLFDTFEGLEEYKTETTHDIKKYKININKINRLFSKFKDVYIHKGIFPKDTGDSIKNENFSLVHLDVNLYKSTVDCLEYFWPRMVKQGVIILHDYNLDKITKKETPCMKALNEFVIKNKLLPLELRGNHVCLIK